MAVHPAVARVVLHGSRGLAGGCRPDSDLDVSLLVDASPMARAALGWVLAQLIATTRDAWRGTVELDQVAWSADEVCPRGSGRDCFGAYKVQRGFEGFVEDAGVEVRRMQPSVVLWGRAHRG